MNSPADPLKHLQRLTDDTGILEHALGRIPRRREGYSTDDQARALWACLEWLDLVEEARAEELHKLIDTYLSFMLWVQDEQGHFHNNIAYDRTKEPESPSDDCLGRCLWAGAVAYARLRERERRLAAAALLEKALPLVGTMRYPRGWAYAMAALSLLSAHHYPHAVEDELRRLAAKLTDAYRRNASADWPWFEPVVAYSNALLPWGLLCAYETVRDEGLLDIATESLDFLIRLSTSEKGRIRPVGNRGWCTPGSRAVWDQQPIDVMKLCLAAAKAYELTGGAHYAETLVRCRDWFHGANDAGEPMANAADGSCYDGIGESGVNLNQGAEAAISYLITEAICRKQ